MWVRSQNRKALLNTNSFTTSKTDEGYRIYADGATFEDYRIGVYPTESRALEVLDEIQKAIILQAQDCINRHDIPFVFEMPKE